MHGLLAILALLLSLGSSGTVTEARLWQRPVKTRYHSVAEFLGTSSAHSMFVELLQAASIYEQLLQKGVQLTLFAPTNDAVEALLNRQGMNIAELAKSVYLDEVLQYHIVPALVTTAEMTSGYTLATQCLGHSMWISSIPARPEALFTINGVDPLEEGVATVVTPNLHAGKAVIHVVDAVLLPPMEGLDLHTMHL